MDSRELITKYIELKTIYTDGPWDSWNEITPERLPIEKHTINSTLGDPTLMTCSISPFTVSLTEDDYDKNGGLSYTSVHTDALNRQLIHDYYKDSYDIELPTDTKIVFGGGAIMMCAALFYAVQKKERRNITVSTNYDIFYQMHKKLTYIAKNVSWTEGDDSDLSLVASPHNPLGMVIDPDTLPQKYRLYDVVYDKYVFTGKHHTVNDKLYKEFRTNKNIFITSSFGKLGLPGARFGFLLTRDEQIADLCEEYVGIISIHYATSGATIARTAYYRHFRDREWQETIYNTILRRRDIFMTHVKRHKIGVLNKTIYVPYVYTDKSNEWWLTNFNVATRKGSDFNDTDDNSRFNLMISPIYWDEFVRRFVG